MGPRASAAATTATLSPSDTLWAAAKRPSTRAPIAEPSPEPPGTRPGEIDACSTLRGSLYLLGRHSAFLCSRCLQFPSAAAMHIRVALQASRSTVGLCVLRTRVVQHAPQSGRGACSARRIRLIDGRGVKVSRRADRQRRAGLRQGVGPGRRRPPRLPPGLQVLDRRSRLLLTGRRAWEEASSGRGRGSVRPSDVAGDGHRRSRPTTPRRRLASTTTPSRAEAAAATVRSASRR